jgi:hypothetical protein
MNRFVRAAAAALVAAGGAGSLGCVTTGDREGGARYRNWVDPCWPERYNAVARAETLAPFSAQVTNGHVLEQTIWNWYFETGTDKLNTAGMAKLDSIAQTRPSPDPKLYLQVARDIATTPENMDKVAALRDDLTARRVVAIQRYMAAQPSIAPVTYEFFVHDPVVTGIYSDFSARAFRGQAQGYRGGVGGGSGSTPTATGGGGQTPPASSIGTGPGSAPPGGPGGGTTGSASGANGPVQ